MENLTTDKLILALGVILVLLGAYNTFYTARKMRGMNARDRSSQQTRWHPAYQTSIASWIRTSADLMGTKSSSAACVTD